MTETQKLDKVFKFYKEGTKLNSTEGLFLLFILFGMTLVFTLLNVSLIVAIILSLVFTVLSTLVVVERINLYCSIYLWKKDYYLNEYLSAPEFYNQY